jgi:thiol-disulfide isomerase/thioredoxin
MNGLASLAIVLGLVAVSTVIGLLWRLRTGRVLERTSAHTVVTAEGLDSSHPFGAAATLLQFSTEFCAPCRSTAVVLGELSAERDGVAHVEIDLTEHPELAREYNILQTPTTFLVDGSGVVRARIGGAPRREELRAALDDLIGRAHATTA